MNVFVLCTGRCGSTTFARACSHIVNFSAGHETRLHELGMDRVNYPNDHIEVDHHLSWFLGKLDRQYGNSAKYVHLTREPERVAASFAEKGDWVGSIATAYQWGLMADSPYPLIETCRDQVETVTRNIELFLKDKDHVMHFQMEEAERQWPEFWAWIGAEGDYPASLSEWSVRHNATRPLIRRRVYSTAQRVVRAWRALFPRR